MKQTISQRRSSTTGPSASRSLISPDSATSIHLHILYQPLMDTYRAHHSCPWRSRGRGRRFRGGSGFGGLSDDEAYPFGFLVVGSNGYDFPLRSLPFLDIFKNIAVVGADLPKDIGVVIAEMSFLEFLLEGGGVFEYFMGELDNCIEFGEVVAVVEVVDGFEVLLVEELAELGGDYLFGLGGWGVGVLFYQEVVFEYAAERLSFLFVLYRQAV